VILVGASLEAAHKRAELLREDLRSLIVQHAGQVLGKITISIGISAFPEHGENPGLLLQAADEALYRAKKEGRDRVILALTH
jgi:diguanylate cyclase (GGDEF)-like protein